MWLRPNLVACMPCSCVTGCSCFVSSSIDIRTQFWRRALQRGICMVLQCVFVCERVAERVLRSFLWVPLTGITGPCGIWASWEQAKDEWTKYRLLTVVFYCSCLLSIVCAMHFAVKWLQHGLARHSASPLPERTNPCGVCSSNVDWFNWLISSISQFE